MQSRMEVGLAQQREGMAESRGALDRERQALESSLDTARRCAEATAEREALENILGEPRVEQSHCVRQSRLQTHSKRSQRSVCSSATVPFPIGSSTKSR
jgi:hypothetical protein